MRTTPVKSTPLSTTYGRHAAPLRSPYPFTAGLPQDTHDQWLGMVYTARSRATIRQVDYVGAHRAVDADL